jgi:hypothetical protein
VPRATASCFPSLDQSNQKICAVVKFSQRLLRKSNTAHEVCEARVGAQGVIKRKDFEVLHLEIVR